MTNRANLQIFSLKCRKCGAQFPASENDAVFVCVNCGSGAELNNGALRQIEVFYAKPNIEPPKGRKTLRLPFWFYTFSLKITAGENILGPSDKSEKFRDLKCAFVPAFSFRGYHYFGDPGIVLTERKSAPALVRSDESAGQIRPPILGASKTTSDARKLLPLAVLSIIDRAVDITDMNFAMKELREHFLGVLFYEDGDKLAETLSGAQFPKYAFMDYAKILAEKEKYRC